jgi:hypothetical protein
MYPTITCILTRILKDKLIKAAIILYPFRKVCISDGESLKVCRLSFDVL